MTRLIRPGNRQGIVPSRRLTAAFYRILAYVMLLFASGTLLASTTSRVLSPQQMEDALNYVEHTIRSAHAGSVNGIPARAEAALDQARDTITRPQTAETFYFVLNRFVQNFDDAHTVIRYKDDFEESLNRLELPLAWNEYGLFFTADAFEFRSGDRIRLMGARDERFLLEQMRTIVASENDGYLKAKSASLLQREDFLQLLGVVGSDDRVVIEAVGIDGTLRRDSIPLTRPSASQDDARWVGYRIWPEASLAVFRFDRFEYTQELVDCMEAFFQDVLSQGIEKLAVDLRNNPGGDSSVAFAFLEHFSDITYASFSVDIRVSPELNQRAPHFAIASMNPMLEQFGLPAIPEHASHYVLNQDLVKASVMTRLTLKPPSDMVKVSGKDLYILTNALTFSSGNLFTILVKDNRLGQIVGQPTGNRVNFNGSELRFDIPHTDLYLNLSTAQMIRPDPELGDADRITPDVLVPRTPVSAAAGLDPVLEYLKVQ